MTVSHLIHRYAYAYKYNNTWINTRIYFSTWFKAAIISNCLLNIYKIFIGINITITHLVGSKSSSLSPTMYLRNT